MCHQNNLRFYDDIAYDKQYKGLILDGYEGIFGCAGHLHVQAVTTHLLRVTLC